MGYVMFFAVCGFCGRLEACGQSNNRMRYAGRLASFRTWARGVAGSVNCQIWVSAFNISSGISLASEKLRSTSAVASLKLRSEGGKMAKVGRGCYVAVAEVDRMFSEI